MSSLWESRVYPLSISSLCLVSSNIGICDYSPCCIINSCVAEAAVSLVDLQFANKVLKV